jgi:small ubiquitin-related modifier
MSDNGSPNVQKPEDAGQTEHLNIKVTDNNNEVFFKIKRTTQLGKLMNAFCDRQGKNITSVRFLFDGQRVQPQDNPDTVRIPLQLSLQKRTRLALLLRHLLIVIYSLAWKTAILSRSTRSKSVVAAKPLLPSHHHNPNDRTTDITYTRHPDFDLCLTCRSVSFSDHIITTARPMQYLAFGDLKTGRGFFFMHLLRALGIRRHWCEDETHLVVSVLLRLSRVL